MTDAGAELNSAMYVVCSGKPANAPSGKRTTSSHVQISLLIGSRYSDAIVPSVLRRLLKCFESGITASIRSGNTCEKPATAKNVTSILRTSSLSAISAGFGFAGVARTTDWVESRLRQAVVMVHVGITSRHPWMRFRECDYRNR